MKVSFVVGDSLRDMIGDFDRLEKPPVKTIMKLEKELSVTFADTTAATHVITGALKASGKTSSDFDGDTWEGRITYGGPSVPQFVDYAIFELARGGAHDFLQPTVAHEPAFERIINAHFMGSKT